MDETKAWLQQRIDYWETEIEAIDSESEDYDRGMLQAFYEVQEFLMGQRR